MKYFLIDRYHFINKLKTDIKAKRGDSIERIVNRVKVCENLLKEDLEAMIKIEDQFWVERKVSEFLYSEVSLLAIIKTDNKFQEQKQRILQSNSIKEIF